jgi:hypothetical protein
MNIKSKVFIFLILIYFVITGVSFADIPQTALVGAWLFDEGNGQAARDTTGKSGSGALMNGAKWVDGKSGKAIYFDGKSGYVEISLPEIFNNIPKNSFTIAYWINVQDISGNGTTWTRVIEVRNDNTNYLQFVIQINSGELGINIVSEGAESTVIVSPVIEADKWYHVAGVWDASKKSIKLYLDGVLQAGVGTSPASPGDKKIISIGRRSDGNAETYFDGTIDDFAILNVALTVEDIKSLMNNGLKFYADVSSLDKLATAWGILKR